MVEFELVLPCYNESKSLRSIVERTVEAAKKAKLSKNTFRLILVENGSRDGSESVIDALFDSDFGGWFKAVKVPTNKGYGHGLWQGLKSSEAPVVAWAHADEPCDPADVFAAFHLLKRDLAQKLVVKGIRRRRSWRDTLVTRAFEFFARLILGLKVRDINAQPKVFPRELLDSLDSPPRGFAFDLYFLYKAQQNDYVVREVSVTFLPKAPDLSSWGLGFSDRYRTLVSTFRYMRGLARLEGRL